VCCIKAGRFSFVALTEHAKGVTAEDYQRFVAKCHRVSSETFVVIPGLEIRFDDGTEVAGIGLSETVIGKTPSEVVSTIRELDAYSVWLHPLKRKRSFDRFLDCDAVEVLNGKVDGTLCPNLGLLRRLHKQNKDGRGRHAIFGLDLHDLEQPREVWIECEVSALTAEEIIRSLRDGRFISCVANGTVPSYGRIGTSSYFWFTVLRLASNVWNSVQVFAPRLLRRHLARFSRPIVEKIKRGRRNHQSLVLSSNEPSCCDSTRGTFEEEPNRSNRKN